MASDSGPLFWLVLAVLLCLFVWAYQIWGRAWNRLNRQELGVINGLKQQPVPQTWQEADSLLPADSPSVSAAILRGALQTGGVPGDVPEFYDWIQTPRYLAGIFVFIGLLGTVLGIAVSVSSLGAAVSNTSSTSDQLSDISRHIFDLLSGMKYAFLCTIGGLFATLIVSALNAYYLSQCRQAEKQIETLALRFFVPMYALRPEQIASTETSLPDVVGALRLSVEKLSLTAMQFSDTVLPTAQSFERASERTAQLSETLLGAGTTLRDELKESAERIESVRKTMEFAGDGFGEMVQNLMDIAANLEGAAAQFAGERVGLTNTVKDAAMEMAGSVRSLGETLTQAQKSQQERMDQIIIHSAANQEKMGLLLRQFELTLSDVTAIAEQSTLRQDVQRLIEQMRTLQQETSASHPQREVMAMRGDVVALGKIVQTMGVQMGEIIGRTQRVDTSLGGLADQMAQMRRHVSLLDEQRTIPVAKRLPRLFHKDYWV